MPVSDRDEFLTGIKLGIESKFILGIVNRSRILPRAGDSGVLVRDLASGRDEFLRGIS